MKRKRYKVGDVLNISIGRYWVEGSPKLTCFVCGQQAKAWPNDNVNIASPVAHGMAHIDGTDRDGLVPLCMDCFSNNPDVAVAHKIWGPDLKTEYGGEFKSEADLADAIDAALGKTKRWVSDH